MYNNYYINTLINIKRKYGEIIFRDIAMLKSLLYSTFPKHGAENALLINLIEIDAYYRLKNKTNDQSDIINNVLLKLKQEYDINENDGFMAINALIDIINNKRRFILLKHRLNISLSKKKKERSLFSPVKAISYKAQLFVDKKVSFSTNNQHIVYIKGGDMNDYNLEHKLIYKFSDVIQGSTGLCHTAGLKDDGSVISYGINKDMQCNTNHFEDIMQVSCGKSHTAGLKKDGTVMYIGNPLLINCNKWKDIKYICSYGNIIAGLDIYSKVHVTGESIWGHLLANEWSNIFKVSIGPFNISAVKNNGTALVLGDNSSNQGLVSGFKDLINIYSGSFHTVGLTYDRFLIGAGDNSYGQLDFSDWKRIVNVIAGDTYTIGVDITGKLHLAGESRLWSEFCEEENLSILV